MLSLPAYLHDNPAPTVPFSTEALDATVLSETPTIFQLERFDAGAFWVSFNKFTLHDQHTYCTSNGTHNSGGLQLRQVFNIRPNTNVHRIEDGIYPEKALPALGVTELLNQACPPNCGLLQAWLDVKTYIDNKYAQQGYDPETRAIMIVTGNCSSLLATSQQGGVWIDNTGQSAPTLRVRWFGLPGPR
jgi:hypothetical protein